jgi:hypothetical protein
MRMVFTAHGRLDDIEETSAFVKFQNYPKVLLHHERRVVIDDIFMVT